MSDTVPWSELRLERSYWVRPPYADHVYSASFLGWNADRSEASFVVYYGEGRDGPVPVSPQGGWDVYDHRPEGLEDHSGNDQPAPNLT